MSSCFTSGPHFLHEWRQCVVQTVYTGYTRNQGFPAEHHSVPRMINDVDVICQCCWCFGWQHEPLWEVDGRLTAAPSESRAGIQSLFSGSPRPLLSWALSAQNTVHPLSTTVWSEMLWWSQPESYFSFFFLHPLIRTSKCCVLFSRRQLDFLEKKGTEIQYCFHIAAQRRGTAWMCQSSQIQDESHLHTPQSCMAKVTEPHQCFAN